MELLAVVKSGSIQFSVSVFSGKSQVCFTVFQ